MPRAIDDFSERLKKSRWVNSRFIIWLVTALLSKAFKAINNRNRKDDRILRKIKTCRRLRPEKDQDLKKIKT